LGLEAGTFGPGLGPGRRGRVAAVRGHARVVPSRPARGEPRVEPVTPSGESARVSRTPAVRPPGRPGRGRGRPPEPRPCGGRCGAAAGRGGARGPPTPTRSAPPRADGYRLRQARPRGRAIGTRPCAGDRPEPSRPPQAPIRGPARRAPRTVHGGTWPTGTHRPP